MVQLTAENSDRKDAFEQLAKQVEALICTTPVLCQMNTKGDSIHYLVCGVDGVRYKLVINKISSNTSAPGLTRHIWQINIPDKLCAGKDVEWY